MVAFRRTFAMPSRDTFSIPPIGELVRRHLADSTVSVDPFARNNAWATYTNDLDPGTAARWHMEAPDFLRMLGAEGVRADLVIFDPPYSPTQIKRCYADAGRRCSRRDTQNAVLYGDCRRLLDGLAVPGCVALMFGWNTVGMGKGWSTEEIVLVCHGGAHNDTICMMQRRDG